MHRIVERALEAIAATDDAPCVDEENSHTPVRAFSRWQDWQAFCERAADGRATPSCVIDFDYQGTLERMYCFHDPFVDSPANWLVVVHVHTQIPWVVRSTSGTGFGISKLTAANVRHASKGNPNSAFKQEFGKFKIVPVSQQLNNGWWTLMQQGKANEMVWEHSDPASVPPLDKQFSSRYLGIRTIIGIGEGLCHQSTVTKSIKQTETTMRGGNTVEYIVAGLSDCTDLLCSEVYTGYPTQRPLPTPTKPKILFVGINVQGKEELGLQAEFGELRDALYSGLGDKYDERVCIDCHYFSTVDGMIGLITRVRPTLVHLGCHGENNGLHFMQAFVNNRKLVQAFDALNKLAREREEPPVRVAVINSCMFANLSRELGQTVEFVIGHHNKLRDTDAISFTKTLYHQLALGSRLLQSFKAAETGHCGYQLVALKSNPDELVLFPVHQVRTMATANTCVKVRSLINVNIVCDSYLQRKSMHAHLHAWLRNTKRDRIAVHGLGGSGKSTLCKLFIKQAYDNGEYDFVAFVRCAGEPANIMLEDYMELAVKLPGNEMNKAQLQSMRASDLRDYVHLVLERSCARWLIVVDDAPHEDTLDGEDGMLRGYPWASGKTIITSRSSVWDKDGKGVCVGEFEEGEAVSWATSQVTGWDKCQDDVRKLVVRLGCFPLAVSQAVHLSKEQFLLPLEYIQQMNSTSEKKWAAKNQEKFERCMKGKRETDLYPFSFVEVVNLSVMTLIQSDADDSLDAVRLLRILSYMHPAAIPMELFTPEEKSHVKLLKSQSLVVDSGEGQCVAMHPLTQEVLREFMMGDSMHDCISRLVEVMHDKVEKLDIDKKSTFLIGWRYHKHVEHLVNVTTYTTEISTKTLVFSWTDKFLLICDRMSTFLADVACQYASSLKLRTAALQWRFIHFGHDHVGVSATLNNIGSVYKSQGEYAKALEKYEESLRIRIKLLGDEHVDVATTLDNIGIVYYNQGEYTKALEKHEKALFIFIKLLGNEHVDVATTLHNIGNVYYSQGEYAKALEEYEESLRIRIKMLGKEHVQVARTLDNIGNVYSRQGKFGKALEKHEESLCIRIKMLGKEHVDVAGTLTNIGSVYDSQGEYAKALEKYEESLCINIKVLGKEHVAVAGTLNNIGVVYESQEEYAKALENYEESLRIYIKTLGNEHVHVARTLNNIGSVYDSQGEYAKALEKHEESLRIRIKVLGKEHVEVATTLDHIGNVYDSQGEYAKALENYEESLRIEIKALGNEHVDVAGTLNIIGSVYYSQGEYTKALELYEESLRIRIKLLGNEHVDVSTTLDNIGNVYYSEGEYAMALERYDESLRIRIKVLGNEHVAVAGTLTSIGNVYDSQGEFAKALEKHEESLRIRIKLLGNEHVDVAGTLNNIGNVYYSQGEYTKALELYEESLRIRIKVLGNEHVDVATTLNNIGSVCSSQREYAKALEKYEESLQIYTRVLGNEHVDVATTLNNIGRVCYSKGEYSKALEKHKESLRIRIEILGKENMEVATTLNNIGSVYKSKGEFNQALENYEESLCIKMKLLGNEHVDVASAYCIIGNVYQSQEQYDQALEYYKKGLDIRCKALGHDNVKVSDINYNIALMYCKEGRKAEAKSLFLKVASVYERIFGAQHSKTRHVISQADTC